jgi:hypothetical protein
MLFVFQLFVRQMSEKKVKTDGNHQVLLSIQQHRRLFCSGKNLPPFVAPSLKLNLKSCKIGYWFFYLPKFFALDFFTFCKDDENCCSFLKGAHRFFNLAHSESLGEFEYLLLEADCEMMQLVLCKLQSLIVVSLSVVGCWV